MVQINCVHVLDTFKLITQSFPSVDKLILYISISNDFKFLIINQIVN